MKKIYSYIMLTLLALLGFEASAAGLTITVKVNDPELISVQNYQSKEYLTFDENNECVVEWGDNVSQYMRILYFQSVTPEGSETVYCKSYKIYDSEGELITEKAINSTARKNVSIPAGADGGSIVFDCGTQTKPKMTVNISGDPAKVNLTFDGVRQSNLVEGTQEIEFPIGARLLYVKPVGQSQLVSVKYNGTEVSPRADSAEGGNTVYGYSVSSPADKSTLDIMTDYPDKDCKVSVLVNEDSHIGYFISTITVNQVPVDVTQWADLTVKAGDEVRVIADDKYNFKVNECGINGVAAANASYSQSAIVTDDITFYWDIAAIERDEAFVFVCQEGSEWYILPSNLEGTASGMIAKKNEEFGNYVLVPSREQDNPYTIMINEMPASATEDSNLYLFRNNELVQTSIPGRYTIAIEPYDVVKGFVGTEQPTLGHVSITLDGLENAPYIQYDMLYSNEDAFDTADGFDALPGTNIQIMPDAEEIGSVTVNGTEIAINEEGYYMFEADGNDMTIVIAAPKAAAERNVTFRIDGADGMFVQYAGLEQVELHDGVNLVNLDEVCPEEDAEGDHSLQVYPMSGYQITAIYYNDADILEDEDYNYGRMWYIPEASNGDKITIVAQPFSRDKSAVVYVEGLDRAYGLVIGDCTGQVNLTDGGALQEGYNTIHFADADLPLMIMSYGVKNKNDQFFAYHNDEVPAFDGYYMIEDAQEGDVIKVYVASEAPQQWNVTYTTTNIFKPLSVVVDKVKNIDDPMSGHASFNGTHVSVKAHNEESIQSVTVNNETIEPNAEGAYEFYVLNHSDVVINGDPTNGVELIQNDLQGDGRVYNLQGIEVKNDQLPAGIYIINGRKVAVK